MENKVLISVVIPAYNEAKYIGQCIENIIMQDYKLLEIIVIDDGSTDNTSEVVKQYPVDLHTQENQGLSAARNLGLSLAKGEYIHFMDADDLVNLSFYSNMLKAIRSVNADMACCSFIHERLPALTTEITEQFLFENTTDKMVFTNVGHQGTACKYLFRTVFLRKHHLQFKLKLRQSQDKVFSLQAVYFSNKIISVPGAVYYYKHRANSATTFQSPKKRARRRQHRKDANAFCAEFANKQQIETISAPKYRTINYTFLAIPALKKRIYITGKIRWYLFGMRVVQKNPVKTNL